MSDQKEGTMYTNDRLLSEEERSTCKKIALSGEGLMNQRVKALLALDMRSTRAEAGEQSGLTLGQVRYLLATFRQKRLKMFDEEILMEIEQQPQIEEITVKLETEAEIEGEAEAKVEEALSTKGEKQKKQSKGKKVKAKVKKSDKKVRKPKKQGEKKGKGKKGKGKKGKGKKAKAKRGKKGNGKASKKKLKK